MSKQQVSSKIFQLDISKVDHINSGIENKYVQIKHSSLTHAKNKNRVMLQIIDISDSILYDKEKAQNTFLALINACVSHELRNPLNSIIAQNIEKEYLIKQIDLILKNELGNLSKE